MSVRNCAFLRGDVLQIRPFITKVLLATKHIHICILIPPPAPNTLTPSITLYQIVRLGTFYLLACNKIPRQRFDRVRNPADPLYAPDIFQRPPISQRDGRHTTESQWPQNLRPMLRWYRQQILGDRIR